MKLQQSEQILHELGPEASIVVAWFFSKGLAGAFVFAFIVFWFVGFFGVLVEPSSGVLAVGAMAAVIALPAALITSLFYLRSLRKTYVYHITNRRCVFSGGILRRVERSVPYHKITDVEISQNLLERLLKVLP